MKHSTNEFTRDPNELFCTRLAELAFGLYWRRQSAPKPEPEEGKSTEGLASAAPWGKSDKVRIAGEEYTEQKLYDALLSNPKFQQRMAEKTNYVPSKWLLEQEMRARNDWPQEGHANPPDVYRTVAEKRLVGVCLSGGGIRSATFNLGVIQGLAQLGLLPCIDYLSSVSGGGYIHEFLAAWILRDKGGRDAVIKKLIPQAEPGCPPRAPEPIKWLLRYASYLTPRRGLFSTDTWTMAAIWLRNTILNQIPILAGLASGFFLLHLLVLAPVYGRAGFWTHDVAEALGVVSVLVKTGVLATLVAAVSLWALGRNLYRQAKMAQFNGFSKPLENANHESPKRRGLAPELLTNTAVRWWIILPWLGCAVWMSFWSQMPTVEDSRLRWLPVVIPCLMVLATTWIVIFAGGALGEFDRLHFTPRHENASRRAWRIFRKIVTGLLFVVAGVAASAIACALAYGFVVGSWWISESVSRWVGPVGNVPEIDPWRIRLMMLPALLLSVPYVAIELSLGLLGRDFMDARREWLARLRAWSLLFGLLWCILVSISLLGPYVVYFLFGKGLAWVYSTLAAVLAAHGTTIFAGWSGKSDGRPTDKGILGFKPMDLLAMLAAPITILGMLTALSFGVSVSVDYLSAILEPYGSAWANLWGTVLVCLAATAAVALIFGWRVDINEFSMQSFYRNRVTRCYLGASLPNRQADPFTGFDDRTKVKMQNVRAQRIPPLVADLLPERFAHLGKPPGEYHGPFPIFCSTLNLTTGEDLATQERKGASFAFTPLYSGYSVNWTDAGENSKVSLNGFVPTEDYAYRERGMQVDTAVAISGAAVNPNMGYNSNPALAFLMTFFNVRLGWWISNPRKRNRWRATENRPTPVVAVWYLFKELFGAVNDASNYVNLSDGGHFDNMGLYELVRRRCSYIIVCDAEADGEMKFEGMGSAITKCRADFGAEIDLDLRPLQIDPETGFSKTHCVVGTVRYPPPPEENEASAARGAGRGATAGTACECLGEAGDDPYTGVIVYLKSSLVGDEPADLLTYKLRHDVFPHDMTSNQWFAETQFESYRRLGHHVAMSAIQPALPPDELAIHTREEIDDLFDRMYQIWYPRTPEMEKYLGDHLRRYEGILAELRSRKELTGLEARLNDERTWAEAMEIAWEAPLDPPNSQDYAMQFANSVLEFMYTVYTNLQLAFPDNRVSPHADWWMCLFRRWSRVKLVQEAWLQHVPMFPEEFRLFARRELKLPPRLPYVE
jgi:hypothetical protein